MEDILKFGLVIVVAFGSLTSQAPNAKRPQSPLGTKLFAKRAAIAPMPNVTSVHPCNRVRIGSRRIFTVNVNNETILCHKLSDTELLSAESCSGRSTTKFAATKMEKAMENAVNLFNVRSSKVANQHNVRVKRASSVNMKPNESILCNCMARRSRDLETGHGRPCGVCASIYRQATPNRFPQYVNGVVCHPNETDTVYSDGKPIGKCVQKTFTQDLLEWKGKWEKDTVNSQRLGLPIYKQKWESYAQLIHSSCVFQFLLN